MTSGHNTSNGGIFSFFSPPLPASHCKVYISQQECAGGRVVRCGDHDQVNAYGMVRSGAVCAADL